MKKNATLIAIILSSIAGHAMAVDGLSANVSATNNYLWRGLEQTQGEGAVSAGIDYNNENGFYLGTWASNASWADGMTYELDLYGGYGGEVEGLGYDVGYIYYAYPDSNAESDFSEVYLNLSYGYFTFGYATLANGEGVSFGDDSYISAGAEFNLADDLALSLNVGTGTDEFYAGEKFVNYSATIAKSGFSFMLSKTDLDDDDLKVAVSYSIDIDL